MQQALEIIRQAERELQPVFSYFDEIAYYNQVKILDKFREHKVREDHFQPSSGYGYGDQGREVLESIYAGVFQTEDALLRTQIVSGTHAISACLFALLNPGETMVAATGKPYDTLANIIGLGKDKRGTLIEKGINYQEVALQIDGFPDIEGIKDAVSANTKLLFLQRSKGYQFRPAVSIEKINEICAAAKMSSKNVIIMVDNCYGEFTEILEPAQVGADIVAGSLIKNPGGGLAQNGGYIAGKKELIEKISWHLTAPGLGKKLGATLINRRYYYMGLFLAPHAVQQSLKGAALAAWIFSYFGFAVLPNWDAIRSDIVQAITLNNAELIKDVCQMVQRYSPLDSDVHLEFGSMPGYENKIIMAAGTFIQGSSMELSCDAPLREPYYAFWQGGLTYEHCRYVLMKIIEDIFMKQKT